MIYSFPFCFRFDVVEPYETAFSVDLTVENVSDIKKFVRDNPGLPFRATDHDLPELFDMMIEASTNAIIAAINKTIIQNGEVPITYDDIDWEDVPLFFDWPEEFFEQ